MIEPATILKVLMAVCAVCAIYEALCRILGALL